MSANKIETNEFSFTTIFQQVDEYLTAGDKQCIDRGDVFDVRIP